MNKENDIKNGILLIIKKYDRNGKIPSTVEIISELHSEYGIELDKDYVNGCLQEIEFDGYVNVTKTLEGDSFPVLEDIGRKFILDGGYESQEDFDDLQINLLTKMNQKIELEIHKLEGDKKWGKWKEFRNWIAIAIAVATLIWQFLE